LAGVEFPSKRNVAKRGATDAYHFCEGGI